MERFFTSMKQVIPYFNEAGNPLLHEWRMGIGEKLPSCIVDLVQGVLFRNSLERMEIKVGNKLT